MKKDYYRKAKSRTWRTISLLIALVLMLSACGKEETVNDAGGTETSDSNEKIVLSGYTQYLDSFGSIEAIIFNECVKEFQELHPEVDFQMEQVAPDMYVTKMQAAAAADELPMLFPALNSYQQTYAESNQILALNQYLDADPEWKDSFVEGAFDDQLIGDTVYGIPYENLLCNVIFYNKDIFAECGIDGFPETLDDFKTVCAKIREKGYTPISVGNKSKDPLASVVAPGIVFKFVSKDWYESVKNGNGAKFTDSDYIDAINALGDLIHMGAFNSDLNSLEAGAATGEYYAGRAAMHINGSWAISGVIQDCPEEVLNVTGIATMPGNIPEYARQIPSGTGWGWCVGANGNEKQTELAIEFLKFLTSKETHQKIVDGGNISAVNVSPSADAELSPLFLDFLDMRANATLVPTPEIQLNAEYVNTSYVGYQEFSVGTITAEDLAEKLQKTLDDNRK